MPRRKKKNPLNADDFRRIALGMKDAVEQSHMGHPDFRAHGRIFATLHSDNRWGMVVLEPEEQQRFVLENPATFAPENGSWGRAGCTRVRLDSVDEDVLGEALTLAWQNSARKSAAKRSKTRRAPASIRPPRKR